jgi:hypothetical protein
MGYLHPVSLHYAELGKDREENTNSSGRKGKLLLALASTVILDSKSRGIHVHNLLSHYF